MDRLSFVQGGCYRGGIPRSMGHLPALRMQAETVAADVGKALR